MEVKAAGPKIERETIVRWDDENGELEIWTASEVVYRRMMKRGYVPSEDGERHAHR